LAIYENHQIRSSVLDRGRIRDWNDYIMHERLAQSLRCGYLRLPSGEAPIAGRLVVVESEHDTLAPGERGGPGVMCPLGTQFLSGTCTAVDPTVLEDITLQQFGFNKTSFSWSCAFKNNKLTAVQVKASVLCLKPAT
jgi:hypothetical protein